MLVNFSFRNFRSFRDSQQFSFEPISGKKEDPLISVAAIYGPNASGKSNFLDAFTYVYWLVRNSYSHGNSGSRLTTDQFLLDVDSEQSDSEFALELIVDDVKYEYSFGVNSREVVYEELIAYYSHQPSLLFLRDMRNADPIKFGSAFTGPKKQLWKITRSNSLFLSVAAAAANDAVEPVYSAITGFTCYDAPNYASELTLIKKQFFTDPERANKLALLIKYADIGIDDLDVRQSNRISLRNNELSSLAESDPIPDEVQQLFEDSIKWNLNYDLYFHHKGPNGGQWFDSARESEGTKAALAFFSVALRSLEKGGLTLIDELDMSLHPLLAQDFVSLFSDASTNPHNAQLIFSTHDVSLMTRSSSFDYVLTRDQIWFTEKDDSGASTLISAMEYSPRSNENIGRNYMNGVYTSLPNPAFHDCFVRFSGKGEQ